MQRLPFFESNSGTTVQKRSSLIISVVDVAIRRCEINSPPATPAASPIADATLVAKDPPQPMKRPAFHGVGRLNVAQTLLGRAAQELHQFLGRGRRQATQFFSRDNNLRLWHLLLN